MSKMHGRIIAQLRRLWLKSEVRAEAIKKQKRYEPRYKKDGTLSKVPKFIGYECERCGVIFEKIEVHHKNPVGKFKNWDTFINRLLFVKSEDLEVLCHECHKKER